MKAALAALILAFGLTTTIPLATATVGFDQAQAQAKKAAPKKAAKKKAAKKKVAKKPAKKAKKAKKAKLGPGKCGTMKYWKGGKCLSKG